MMNYYGDQIRWFVGNVTDINDPLQMGRARVRIIGIHQDNEVEIPAENLPWAQTVVPVTQGGTNGLGNILGIQPGARVFGIFMAGPDSQLPLILGSMPKYEAESDGDRSTNQLARGTNTLAERKVTQDTDPTKIANGEPFDEPDSPYAAVYPKNFVYETPRGHVIEIDDSFTTDDDGNETADNSRIHIYHRSGSFVEMHPNGDVVTHHKNGFKTVHGNDKVYITGDLDITVNGNMNVTVKGDVTETFEGNQTTTITKNLDVDAARIDLN